MYFNVKYTDVKYNVTCTCSTREKAEYDKTVMSNEPGIETRHMLWGGGITVRTGAVKGVEVKDGEA